MVAAEIFDIDAWLAMAELQEVGAEDGHALGATARRHEHKEIPQVWQMHLSQWSACTATVV